MYANICAASQFSITEHSRADLYNGGRLRELELLLCERGVGDREQGVVRPVREPVDGAAVDERWEHAQPRAKRCPDRAHAHHQVQILTKRTEQGQLSQTTCCKKHLRSNTSREFALHSTVETSMRHG